MAQSSKTDSPRLVDNYDKPGICGLVDGFWRADEISFERADPSMQQCPWARLLAGLDVGDTPDEQLARTWIVAQDLRLIYHCPD